MIIAIQHQCSHTLWFIKVLIFVQQGNILLRISIWITTYVLPRNILHSFFTWTKITFWKEWVRLTFGLNYTQTSFYVVIVFVRWNNAIRTRTTQDQRIIILGPSTTRSLPEQLSYVFFQLSDQVGAVADHSLLPPYLYIKHILWGIMAG